MFHIVKINSLLTSCGSLFIALCLFIAGSTYCFADDGRCLYNQQWWSVDSFWNTPIDNNRAIKKNFSDLAIRNYIALNKTLVMNWDSAGVALIYSDSKIDPTYSITFKNYPGWTWKFDQVPQNTELIKAVKYRIDEGNTDGMTCVYDANKEGFYSFWQPRINEDNKTISITTGAFNRIKGIGGSAINQYTPSGGRVAGVSYCGGLILPREISAGVIDHALAMVWPANLNYSYEAAKKAGVDPYVYPAHHTDGTSKSIVGAIPMGARIQLSPDLDHIDLLKLGLFRHGDLVVARALQKYGAYIVDSNAENSNAGLYYKSGYGDGKFLYNVTNPWPIEIFNYMRFIDGPQKRKHETAADVGHPVRIN